MPKKPRPNLCGPCYEAILSSRLWFCRSPFPFQDFMIIGKAVIPALMKEVKAIAYSGTQGASGYAPENTIAAFELGIRQGCHGFEFDVQLSRDGEPVVHHDWSVARTTGGSGEIRDLTFREIRTLDAGKWFSPEFRGQKIPALAEVLEVVPEAMLLNVELKSRASDCRDWRKKHCPF